MTETIDMGAIDIYNADLQAIVCHACYTASVRRLDLQGPSPTVPLDQPNWIQRASQFSVNIDLDMGGSDLQSTDLDMAVESIAQALEVASVGRCIAERSMCPNRSLDLGIVVVSMLKLYILSG